MNRPHVHERMKNDIEVYRDLQVLQGTHIPILHFTSVSDGLESVLVTKNVGDVIEKLTQSMKTAK